MTKFFLGKILHCHAVQERTSDQYVSMRLNGQILGPKYITKELPSGRVSESANRPPIPLCQDG